MNANRFYVYCIFVDGVARYVGAGSGMRLFHVNTQFLSQSYADRQIEAVEKTGAKITRSVLHEKLTRNEALRLEREEIKKIGRENLNEGTLWNCSDGDNCPSRYGKNSLARIFSSEACEQRSKTLTGKKQTLEHIRAVQEGLRKARLARQNNSSL